MVCFSLQSYDYEPIDIDVANRRRKTYKISDDVSDDAAALCASSRRQDQRLLSNITNKLVSLNHREAGKSTRRYARDFGTFRRVELYATT